MSTKTGEYKKSDDGEFPPTEESSYIHLTPRSCDLYRVTNFVVNYIMRLLMYPFVVRFDGLQSDGG